MTTIVAQGGNGQMKALFMAMFQVLGFWLREQRLAGLMKARRAVERRLTAERHVLMYFAFLQWGRTVQVIPPPLIPASDSESEETDHGIDEIQDTPDLHEDFRLDYSASRNYALRGILLNRFHWPMLTWTNQRCHYEQVHSIAEVLSDVDAKFQSLQRGFVARLELLLNAALTGS